MYIRVHVYDDGDTELLKTASVETDHLHFDELTQLEDLKKELDSYGHDEGRIETAIQEVLDNGEFEAIIV